MSIMTFFIACSEDSVSMKDNKFEQAGKDLRVEKGNDDYYCNIFLVPSKLAIVGLEAGVEKPIKIYWCCGPGMAGWPIGGCQVVSKKFYDIVNTKEDEKLVIEVGVSVFDIVGDIPEIKNPKDIISIKIYDSPVIDGKKIKDGVYVVNKEGYVLFDLVDAN